MKKLMKKAVTVLGSVAMVGATISGAAAASYPAPFDSGSYAVVYGSSDDMAAATTVANGLPSVGGSTTVTGGDSYKLEKSSTKFQLGNTMTGVVSSTVSDDDLPTLLADGVYVDDDNDEFDYTQKITLKALKLQMFDDNDYKEDTPTVGFNISAGNDVLDYTIEFTDEPLLADLTSTDLMLMGKNYYVLSKSVGSSGTILTLLDSAADTVLTEGDTVTLTAGGKEYVVSTSFISSTEVKLVVNGELTNSLAEAQTQKLNDGSYIGVKDILYNSKDTGVSKVEFSIGRGKLVLTDGSDIELNEESITDLSVDIVNTTTALQSITINWDAEDDMFITEDSEIVMPGFGAVKLSYTGLTYPEEEEFTVGYGGDSYAEISNFPLKDSTEDIAILYGSSGNFSGIGKDSTSLLRTGNGSSIVFDADTDDQFVVSWSDGNDAESYLMRATNFKVDSSINRTTFQYRKDGAWVDAKEDRKNGDEFSIGNVDLTVGAIHKIGKNVTIIGGSGVSFNTLYSKEGLKVYLPWTNSTSNAGSGGVIHHGELFLSGSTNFSIAPAGHNADSFYLTMIEEDKDGNKGSGDVINVTLSWNSQSSAEVTASAVTGGEGTSSEIGDTDVYRNFVYSALATEILHDTGGDQDKVTLVYHGDEVTAGVYLTSASASVSSSGTKTFMDDESSSYSGKNVVVVGGSCVNSVAASLLGGALCGDAFTGATTVGPGQFLIQTFDWNGKTATVVAGYEKDDTAKAATYLANSNNDVSTSVGAKYVGSTTDSTAVMVN